MPTLQPLPGIEVIITLPLYNTALLKILEMPTPLFLLLISKPISSSVAISYNTNNYKNFFSIMNFTMRLPYKHARFCSIQINS